MLCNFQMCDALKKGVTYAQKNLASGEKRMLGFFSITSFLENNVFLKETFLSFVNTRSYHVYYVKGQWSEMILQYLLVLGSLQLFSRSLWCEQTILARFVYNIYLTTTCLSVMLASRFKWLRFSDCRFRSRYYLFK